MGIDFAILLPVSVRNCDSASYTSKCLRVDQWIQQLYPKQANINNIVLYSRLVSANMDYKFHNMVQLACYPPFRAAVMLVMHISQSALQ